MNARMPAPGPIPETVREPTFTTALGYCLSSTRDQVDQRQLRWLITTSLVAAIKSPDRLNQRWVGSDSWNWWPHGSHAPDVVATDDRDELALVLEAKSLRASLQVTSARKVRAAIAATDTRLAKNDRERDARSVEISQRAVPTDPAWDASHTFDECAGAGDVCLFHTGRGSLAGVHQGDAYASQIAYLGADVKIPDGGLDEVDFIALLPTAKSARAWGTGLVSSDRWHVAAVAEFLELLDAGSSELASDQKAWLKHLLSIAAKLYAPEKGRLGTRDEIHQAYLDAIDD